MKRTFAILLGFCLAAGVRGADVKWEHSYDTALETAKKEKKLVMVDVYTDWCGWCKRLDKEVYSDKTVTEKLNKSFVALKINPEKSQKNAKLSKQFGTKGFPHIVFLDTTGKKIHEIGGYVPADAFSQQLDQVVKQGRK